MNKVKNILILILGGIIVWQYFSARPLKTVKQEVFSTPEMKGTTKVQIVEKITLDTVQIKGEVVEVDAQWREKYERALLDNDSITQRNLFLESIKIRNYHETLVHNDTIKIDGYFKVRGSLLEYATNYKIKSIDFLYTPKIIRERPRLSVGFGLEVSNSLAKLGMDFTNNKGNRFSVGLDNQKGFWVGVGKSFTLKK